MTQSKMRVLLTGGTGYIGSHTAIALLEQNHDVLLFDNLSNSQRHTVDRIRHITGKQAPFVQGDIRNTDLLTQTLRDFQADAVIHFAGLKAVGESVEQPIAYYANNVQGTISLLQAMQQCRVYKLVFSSSATVYGKPQYLPLDEAHPTSATNPYGRTKLHIEEMLQDLAASDACWKIICLRYFNPLGAHASGLLGERPNGIPNNLMPYIAQVAAGSLPFVQVFGNDYPTPDGTGVRDFIHVCDLAEGHAAALPFLHAQNGWHAINLGTGKGTSVLELIKAFAEANGIDVPYRIMPRRPGDVDTCFASPTKAHNVLGWKAQRDIQEMCKSAWLWQTMQG